MDNKKFLLGVGLSNLSEREVLEFIIKGLKKKQKKYYIVTPNPELLVIANDNFRYKNVLNSAKLALPDGVGVIFAGKVLGISLKDRITGVDLLQSLCKKVAKQPITVGFLGGGPKIAERTAECLREKYPGLRISFTAQELNTRYKILNTDILFVAFGSPKQEFWIHDNLKKLPVKVAIGVGGAFNMISGNVIRAPLWIRNLGLEWLFRLVIQPWRIKRQLSLIKFLFLVLKEKFAI